VPGVTGTRDAQSASGALPSQPIGP
jgi:hypothetical protein